jgi:hypothetical protein
MTRRLEQLQGRDVGCVYGRAVCGVFFTYYIHPLAAGWLLFGDGGSFAELRRLCISPDFREDNPGPGLRQQGRDRTSEAVCDGS